MKIINFDNLSFAQKAKLVLKNGTFVSKADFKDLEISLYKIGEEYIEIWYEPKTETVKDIKSLDASKFTPFLKHLNLLYLN